MNWTLICWIAALVVFIVDALSVAPAKIKLSSIGLALFVLGFIIQRT